MKKPPVAVTHRRKWLVHELPRLRQQGSLTIGECTFRVIAPPCRLRTNYRLTSYWTAGSSPPNEGALAIPDAVFAELVSKRQSSPGTAQKAVVAGEGPKDVTRQIHVGALHHGACGAACGRRA
jgi:hypothetical protein